MVPARRRDRPEIPPRATDTGLKILSRGCAHGPARSVPPFIASESGKSWRNATFAPSSARPSGSPQMHGIHQRQQRVAGRHVAEFHQRVSARSRTSQIVGAHRAFGDRRSLSRATASIASRRDARRQHVDRRSSGAAPEEASTACASAISGRTLSMDDAWQSATTELIQRERKIEVRTTLMFLHRR